MSTNEELRKIVRDKYGEIAEGNDTEMTTSCCAPSCCYVDPDITVFSEDYTKLQGYNPDADLGLGCGLPTEFAKIKEGDTVVDLGSGAGNDCFVARSIVGESGKVIGVDMTPKMVEKARINAEKLKLNNVEFRLGEIENLPVQSRIFNVLMSLKVQCVEALVPTTKFKLVKLHQKTLREPGNVFL